MKEKADFIRSHGLGVHSFRKIPFVPKALPETHKAGNMQNFPEPVDMEILATYGFRTVLPEYPHPAARLSESGGTDPCVLFFSPEIDKDLQFLPQP